MTYDTHESIYRELIESFLAHSITPADFVHQYIDQWGSDRDAQWLLIESEGDAAETEESLGAVLDQAFTACDCYDPEPEGEIEIGEDQLRAEISDLYRARWGQGHAV